MDKIQSQALKAKPWIQTLKPRRPPSPLRTIDYRVFLIPVILMIVGGLIWGTTAFFQPTNLSLILLGEIIFAIGMFVAIILGFWVMTIIRMPAH
jgi:Ca2+/Na+ antiporter